MKMTPEGKIKAKVKTLLNATPMTYYDMPVPSGFGKSGLDFNCCVAGHALYIETKASSNEHLTPRQRECALRMLASGAAVFVVCGPSSLEALRRWLARASARVPC